MSCLLGWIFIAIVTDWCILRDLFHHRHKDKQKTSSRGVIYQIRDKKVHRSKNIPWCSYSRQKSDAFAGFCWCLHVCFGNVTNPAPPQSNLVLYSVPVGGIACQLSPKQDCDQWEKVEADARKVLAASSFHHLLVLWRIAVYNGFVRVWDW